MKVSVRVSLRGMLRLIRVDTLRRVHNVDFLVERLIYIYIFILYAINKCSGHRSGHRSGLCKLQEHLQPM